MLDAERHIDHLLTTGEAVPAPAGVASWAAIADQEAWSASARENPIEFWSRQATRIAWEREPATVFSGTLSDAHWFADGRLNATITCLDRQVAIGAQRVAYHAICEDGSERTISYGELLAYVNRCANALAADGVKKGDRVCIYMPLTIEGIVAMLACARLGAVHSVIYAGLRSGALRDRIVDAGAGVLIAADVTYRRGKAVDLRKVVTAAVEGLDQVRRVIIHQRGGHTALATRERDWDAFLEGSSDCREAEIVSAEDPLFILYTSGTTGKPKGVVMNHGGYLTGCAAMLADTTSLTTRDVYWCTSDIGWIVGHSLIVYGSLANGFHHVIREGAPDWPDGGSTYAVIERLGVTKLYTAPTLARMLMRLGPALTQSYDLGSLQAIFCAGEPLNPEAWRFLYEAVGRERVAVCNHWWQTETGAMMLGYLPTSTIRSDRSGKAFGPIAFDVLDKSGNPVPRGAGGLLVIREPWPTMFAGIWGDRDRYLDYFNQIPGVYTAGDVASIDAAGYLTVVGRADDVLNVAGHRISTADVESALVAHSACGEAGVIGKPDPIKGEAIKAFVALRVGFEPSEELRAELIAHVREYLGPIAAPAEIAFVTKLPKTRSGKIMRRLLKAQEAGTDVGDTTTLEE